MDREEFLELRKYCADCDRLGAEAGRVEDRLGKKEGVRRHFVGRIGPWSRSGGVLDGPLGSNARAAAAGVAGDGGGLGIIAAPGVGDAVAKRKPERHCAQKRITPRRVIERYNDLSDLSNSVDFAADKKLTSPKYYDSSNRTGCSCVPWAPNSRC